MTKFEIIAVLRLSSDKTAVGGRLLDEYVPAARQMQVGDLTMQILGNNMLAGAGDAPNDLPLLDEADYAFCPADCAEALRGGPYRFVASCGEGTIAAAMEELKRIL